MCKPASSILIVSILILVASLGDAPSAFASSSNGDSQSQGIRTNGVYYFVIEGEKDANGIPLCSAVRLYDDGTALDTQFHGKPADLVTWFHRDNVNLYPGRWSLEGDTLTVRVSTGLEETTRSGTLQADGWRITDLVLFPFAPLAFSGPAGKPSENRRPNFIGTGESAIGFDYDKAGNLVGINHEIEILAGDPDGDSLQYTWTASNGTLEPSGPKVVWKRPLEYGRPLPGEISVEVSDGKGGTVSFKRAMD